MIQFKPGLTEYSLTTTGGVIKFAVEISPELTKTEAYNLLFIFKGKGGTGEARNPYLAFSNMFKPYTSSNKAILIHIQSIDIKKGWRLIGTGSKNDIDAFDDVYDLVRQDLDQTLLMNIWGFGSSNGGCFVHLLGSEEYFDKICVASASLWKPTITLDPVNILHIHGKADLSVPYNGGERHGFIFWSAPESIKFYSEVNVAPTLSKLNTSIEETFIYKDAAGNVRAKLIAHKTAGHNVLSVKNYAPEIFQFLND